MTVNRNRNPRIFGAILLALSQLFVGCAADVVPMAEEELSRHANQTMEIALAGKRNPRSAEADTLQGWAELVSDSFTNAQVGKLSELSSNYNFDPNLDDTTLRANYVAFFNEASSSIPGFSAASDQLLQEVLFGSGGPSEQIACGGVCIFIIGAVAGVIIGVLIETAVDHVYRCEYSAAWVGYGGADRGCQTMACQEVRVCWLEGYHDTPPLFAECRDPAGGSDHVPTGLPECLHVCMGQPPTPVGPGEKGCFDGPAIPLASFVTVE